MDGFRIFIGENTNEITVIPELHEMLSLAGPCKHKAVLFLVVFCR